MFAAAVVAGALLLLGPALAKLLWGVDEVVSTLEDRGYVGFGDGIEVEFEKGE